MPMPPAKSFTLAGALPLHQKETHGMSGPVTATFSLAQLGVLGGVLLAAEALKEARAMGAEYDEILARLADREAGLAEARQARQNARLERQAQLRRDGERLSARLDRLVGLGEMLAANTAEGADRLAMNRPDRPADGDEAAWSRYLGELEAEIQRLEALFAEIGKTRGLASADALPSAEAPGLDEVLRAYARQRGLDARLNPALAAEFEATAARILARLELAEGETLPRALEQLARAVLLAPNVERAEALASELRLAVQRRREERAEQEKDAAEASELLDSLGEAAPEPLRLALERVAVGAEALDAETRELARRLAADLAAARARREQEAAAVVLEQSLRDLGYEVEAIDQTLFVAGGVVHFQRQGWEEYHVRLRLDAQAGKMNFNVVRARGEAESAERKRLDYLAEDRWCAEFPRLRDTLKARGIDLEVTRQLGAGELPVQAVDPASLPRRQEEEDRRRDRAQPLQQPLR